MTATKLNNVSDIYRLTPVQQGLLFHTLYTPDAGQYFEQMLYHVRGPLDLHTFVLAWRALVPRHAVLRTAFVWEGLKEPLQIVRTVVELPVQAHDWRDLTPPEQAARLETFLHRDRCQGVNLAQAPLLRLNLWRYAEEHHVLLLSFHHLILDGWSLTVLLRDWRTCYEAEQAHRAISLPPVRPYRNYLAWLERQDETQAETYWRGKLRGVLAPTSWRVERLAAPNTAPDAGVAGCTLRLSEPTTAALRRLAHDQQLTLNTVLNGAWALLWSIYSGEADVVFGAVVSGRNADLADIASTVGVFMQTLPLRVRLPGNQPLLPWLRALRMQQSADEPFGYVALGRIQKWSEVPANTPLFESVVAFENYPAPDVQHPQSPTLHFWQARERTHYPLVVQIVPEKELTIHLGYQAARFHAATMERLLRHYRTILEAFASDPHRRLRDYHLLTPDERQEVMRMAYSQQADHGEARLVHDMFTAWAGQIPEAVAVQSVDAGASLSLTYRELRDRAQQLAEHLGALGVGLEGIVGVCMESTPAMLVALFGILQTGGVFLPLDPAYPQERLVFMLRDAAAQVLIVADEAAHVLPGLDIQRVRLRLDGTVVDTRHLPSLEQSCQADARQPVRPEHLAYVIYTSGSTGQPKAVAVPHQGFRNLIAAQVRSFQLRPGHRFLQFASLSFDAAIWEISLALCAGATVYVGRRQTLQPGLPLVEILRQWAISHVVLPPSVLAVLPDAPLPQLSTLIVGGEACAADLAARWSSGRTFVNAYGPTEASVCTTTEVFAGDTLPIGRPIANTQVYILDRDLRPLPAGIPGELYIGGVGLARGYLHRPRFTAAAFIPNPFVDAARPAETSTRLYKTGDLACWLPDGRIAYLGRMDHQMKIRGFRIEPGEIEATLLKHPAIRDALVVSHNHRTPEPQLVAYIVPSPEVDVDPHGHCSAALRHDLKQYLHAALPAYMVPAVFVPLAAFPLTANGKLDRHALPEPTPHAWWSDPAFSRPASALEQQIAAVWQDILHLDTVGSNDNFFDLGGDSLLIVRVYSQLRALFGPRLALVDLFHYPTIRSLAHYLDPAHDQGGPLSPPPTQTASHETRRQATLQRRHLRQQARGSNQEV